jgi:hypothetical protein
VTSLYVLKEFIACLASCVSMFVTPFLQNKQIFLIATPFILPLEFGFS